MRLLVTGGAGFIGSNFIRYWLDAHREDDLINLDLLTYAGSLDSLGDVESDKRYRFVKGDITDSTLVRDVMTTSRPDTIVNFAAESHNSRALLDPTSFFRTNVLGTQTLIEAARLAKVSRFHQISTCEVFGELPLDSEGMFTEASPLMPRTPYSASKAAADLVVRAYHETFDVATTVSNCANNYGPYQYPEKMVPLFITNALDERPLPLYRSSQNRREWLHVLDHCRAIDAIIHRGVPGESYNIGSGEERTIEEIADAVLALLGKPPALKTYVEDRPGHDLRYALDFNKIRTELGWHAAVTFEDGLASTVNWYRQNETWWRAKKGLASAAIDEFSWPVTAEVGSRSPS